jgi:hypothetical protein
MPGKKLTWKEATKPIDVETGVEHQFVVPSPESYKLVLTSAHFNLSSAVFLPEVPAKPAELPADAAPFSNDDLWKDLSETKKAFATTLRETPLEEPEGGDILEDGITVIVSALQFADSHSSHRLLVAGHTDTSGPDELNDALSEARAKCVIALLQGDKDAFVAAGKQFHVRDDDGAMLGHCARTRGWPCTPADVSAPSRTEIKAFQQRYNDDFGKQIAVDGRVGDETRGAYFDVFDDDLAVAVGDGGTLSSLRGKVQYVSGSQKYLACGENFPIEAAGQDNVVSETNRRVELLFFPSSDLPDVKRPDAAFVIYRSGRFPFEPVDPSTLAERPGKDLPARDVDLVAAVLPRDAPEREPLATSMPKLQASPDPDDPLAFVEPFEEAFIASGLETGQGPDEPPDGETAVA